MADAYFHFRVAPEEWRHLFTKALSDDKVILKFWVSMAFGLRAAPLVFGRLAALLGRLLQGLFLPCEALLQIYMDDPLLLTA
eukprot:4680922-Amphidinium_carterae.1